MKVGYIGLGMQGKYLAINLANAGYDLMVFDVRPEPLEELAAAGAKIAGRMRKLPNTPTSSSPVFSTTPRLKRSSRAPTAC